MRDLTLTSVPPPPAGAAATSREKTTSSTSLYAFRLSTSLTILTAGLAATAKTTRRRCSTRPGCAARGTAEMR